MNKRVSTEILPTHTPVLLAGAVQRAVALLRAGEPVALPTETVYGLAANALDPAAVERVFAIKHRPSYNPVIVHVASLEMARQCVSVWPDSAARLAKAFWPGPLTLVLPRAALIPDAVTAGGVTVAIRWPSHPVFQAVIRAGNLPLAAPSANRSTRISPTTAQHVLQSLGGRVALVLDGGPCEVGIESTVLDLTPPVPVVLRPGMVSGLAIARILGLPGALNPAAPETGPARRSPGRLPRHYAPRARLEVWEWANDDAFAQCLQRSGWNPADTCLLVHHHLPASTTGFRRVALIPSDPAAYARALYAELHQCDDAGARHVIVEAPPDDDAWRAVRDRLQRASRAVP